MTLVTPRTILRFICVYDARAYHDLESDPSVKQFLGGPIKRTLEETANKIAQAGATWAVLAVIDRSTNEFIGRCGLLRAPESMEEAEVHIALGRDHSNKGLATEVIRALIQSGFDELNLRTINAVVHPQNSACIRVLEKTGMVFVGYYDPPYPGDWKKGFKSYSIKASL